MCQKHTEARSQGTPYTPGHDAARGYGTGWKDFARDFIEGKLCKCGNSAKVCGHKIRAKELVESYGEDYLQVILRNGLQAQYFEPLCFRCNNSQRWAEQRRKESSWGY